MNIEDSMIAEGLRNRFSGMETFLTIWIGQVVSLFGTAMTRFALMIWVYEQTENATALALLGFFAFISYAVVSPFAGVWVDRMDRRKVLLYSDLAAGIMTLVMLSLYAAGSLEIWHIYVAQFLTGTFEAFQVPAYDAATTMLVPKNQYGRASGLGSLANNSSRVLAPFLAGLLLTAIDITGVMLIDVATFLVAVFTLSIVVIPNPEPHESVAKPSMRRELREGIRYVTERRGLLGLLLINSFFNFPAALTYFSILPAMILSRTDGDKFALASVQVALGIGGIIGAITLSGWNVKFKKQIHPFLLGTALSYIFGDFLMAVGRGIPVWFVASLMTTFFIPFIISADRVIWQSKVDPRMQGRVFAVQNTARVILLPIGFLMAGPLADRVFEPAMQAGGSLAPVFGWLVGTGDGAGMAVMFLMTAAMGFSISMSGYLFPAIRNVESDLPDHDVD
jgi:MFS transporter, DHA3 family, macrolide efflux protein